MFDRVGYKEKAKEIYRKYTGSALVAGLVLWFFGATTNTSNVEIRMKAGTPSGTFNPDIAETVSTAVNPFIRMLPVAVGVMLFIALIVLVVFIPVTTMAKTYLRRLSEDNSNPDWFEAIKRGGYLRLMGILILRAIGETIGLLLFIAPGIYLSYAWRYVDQIAVDFPEYSVGQVFAESKRMTQGYKWDLFVLDISFIGWAIVVGIVAGISFGILGVIGSIVLNPYIGLSDMIAYDDLKAKLYGERDIEDLGDTITIDII